MGWSRNTVDDKTWSRVKDADAARAVDRWGTREEIDRQRQGRENRDNPRRS